MLEWNDRNPEYIFHYVPVKIRYSYTEDSTAVRFGKYPVLAMRFYKGKNVEGFMIWEMLNGFRYLYKTYRDECGPCLYWREASPHRESQTDDGRRV